MFDEFNAFATCSNMLEWPAGSSSVGVRENRKLNGQRRSAPGDRQRTDHHLRNVSPDSSRFCDRGVRDLLLVRQVNAMTRKPEALPALLTKLCPYCFPEIPLEVTKCAPCAS